MKYLYRSIFITIVIASTLLGSCKKQAKCGCDGDIINSFVGEAVYIYFDEENKSAEFTYPYAPTARYYFCNPVEMMPELTKFKSGDRVLIDCDLYYECNYLMQSSNSYYGSMYQAYMVDVSKIETAIYGNDK